jgi:hypothetical protein
VTLAIYHNGIQVGTTVTNPVFSGSGFCFTLNGANFTPPDGYDFVATATFTLSNGTSSYTVVQSSSTPGNGVQPGQNNDYFVNCPDNCCTNFVKTVVATTTASSTQPGQFNIAATLSAGPNAITKVRASLEYFSLATSSADCERCMNDPAKWGSFLSPTPIGTTGLQPALTYAPNTTAGSKEIIWKRPDGQSVPLTGQSTSFVLVTPDPMPLSCCSDVIHFCIRYVFTDSMCVTCDTLVCYSIGWDRLVQPEALRGERDPVNVALTASRQALQSTRFGAQMEAWYAELNHKDGVSVMLARHRKDVLALIEIGRKLIERNAVLERADVDVFARVLHMMDTEIAPAPKGFLELALKHLRDTCGQKWDQVVKSLSR